MLAETRYSVPTMVFDGPKEVWRSLQCPTKVPLIGLSTGLKLNLHYHDIYRR